MTQYKKIKDYQLDSLNRMNTIKAQTLKDDDNFKDIDIEKIKHTGKFKVQEASIQKLDILNYLITQIEKLQLPKEIYYQKTGDNIDRYLLNYGNTDVAASLKSPNQFIYYKNDYGSYDWYYFDISSSTLYHNQWNWGSILKTLNVETKKC